MTFRFADGPQGWTAGIADYTQLITPDSMMYVADYRPVPAPFTSSALFMSSHNHTDDAFMFYKHQVPGLTPGTRYAATFTVTIATDVPQGCGGAGGAPGESVFVKAGAAAMEPVVVLDNTGNYRMNVDKGNQSTSGANAVVIGNVANDLPCVAPNVGMWRPKTLTSASGAVSVVANPDGSAWLIVGTDSAYEGVTSVYITGFDVSFQKAS